MSDNYYTIQIPVPRLTGYRTLITNSAILLFGVVAIVWPQFTAPSAETINHVFNEVNGIVLAVVGVINIFLRHITSTPILHRKPPELDAEPPISELASLVPARIARPERVLYNATIANYYANVLVDNNSSEALEELKTFIETQIHSPNDVNDLWGKISDEAKYAEQFLSSASSNRQYPCDLTLSNKLDIVEVALDSEHVSTDIAMLLNAEPDDENDSDMVVPEGYEVDLPNFVLKQDTTKTDPNQAVTG